MKKYFRFDNEPITGGQYLIRMLLGSGAITFFGLGLWVLAATGYKRAGAFGWKSAFRVMSAIFVPIHGIGYLIMKMVPEFRGYSDADINFIALFFLVVSYPIHLVLLFKNGNKKVEVEGEWI